jgi:uncharacterized protein
MTKAEIIAKLRVLKPELSATDNVDRLAVFGSVARGEGRSDSDIDILVTFRHPPGYFGFVTLQDRLSQHLGAPVDLFTDAGLHPALRERVLREAIDV